MLGTLLSMSREIKRRRGPERRLVRQSGEVKKKASVPLAFFVSTRLTV